MSDVNPHLDERPSFKNKVKNDMKDIGKEAGKMAKDSIRNFFLDMVNRLLGGNKLPNGYYRNGYHYNYSSSSQGRGSGGYINARNDGYERYDEINSVQRTFPDISKGRYSTDDVATIQRNLKDTFEWQKYFSISDVLVHCGRGSESQPAYRNWGWRSMECIEWQRAGFDEDGNQLRRLVLPDPVPLKNLK